MNKILILDSSKSVRKSLCEILTLEGYSTIECERCDEAERELVAAIAAKSPITGAIINSNIEELPPTLLTTPHIVISDSPSIDEAVLWMQRSASDYISRPINISRLLASLKRIVTQHATISIADTQTNAQTNSHRRSRQTKHKGGAPKMVGTSTQIEYLKGLILKVAPSDARVMILGENGTGKELVARSIHEMSPRYNAPFVEVNCAAIPSELIESELFGHEKGAFTSAIKQRQGKFEQANGGTLFLDEIGDMSLAAQAKVLRALQERKICRVGSDKDIDVDVRVVAATNKDIQHEIEEGNFREDLYHRLGVIVIRVAALRDRSGDIPSLVRHFLKEICEEYHIDCKEISDEAIRILSTLKWSGNIRELHNVVERLVVLSDKRIEAHDVETYCL